MGDDNLVPSFEPESEKSSKVLAILSAAASDNSSEVSLAEMELRDVDLISTPLPMPLVLSLHTLNLSRNRLVALPVEICALTALISLDVSRNSLKSLPPEIGQLTQLVQLTALSNNFRLRLLPIKELSELPALKVLDLRFNSKLKEAAKTALTCSLPSRVQLRCSTVPKESTSPKLSAGERDAESLQSQLEPLSTPQLRKRLYRTFGVELEGEESYDRETVMRRLLTCYAEEPRSIRYEQGVPLRAAMLDDLLTEMELINWPDAPRERPKISAERYMILQRPGVGDASSAKAKKEAAKLQKYQRIWDKAVEAIEEIDEEFANRFTALAVTRNFMGSPHIDTLNVGPFYGLSMGDFSQTGGKICVECSATTVAEIETRGRLAKVDGRFPHWVSKYEGTRYSLIYYVTSGEVIPQTTAVFEPLQREESATPWVSPPIFVL